MKDICPSTRPYVFKNDRIVPDLMKSFIDPVNQFFLDVNGGGVHSNFDISPEIKRGFMIGRACRPCNRSPFPYPQSSWLLPLGTCQKYCVSYPH